MKKLILSVYLALLIATVASAQNKLMCRDGIVTFFSEAPLENIEAKNVNVNAILDLTRNEVAVSIPMKSFKFKKSLMEEHFNENYVESEKFPKAVFTGNVVTEKPIDLDKNENIAFEAIGSLTLHGVTKSVRTAGTLEIKDKIATARTKFIIAIEDYDIEVPTLLIKNIAEEVAITVELRLTAQKI